jgi:hypothetical protein
MLEYILISITTIIILFFAYIKIKYPFWNIQPVYHTYNWWSRSPSIVYNNNKPYPTKFLDFININTEQYLNQNDYSREKILNLIQNCYNSNDNIVYYIKLPDIDAFFTGQSEPSIISIYNELYFDKIQDTIQPAILNPYGIITSRHLKFYIKPSLYDNVFIDYNIFFIDFLGIHREKEQIINRRKLLQTHEYNQRLQNPNVLISLIKKDKELFEGIVPFINYETNVYKLTDFKLPNISLEYSIIELTNKNINDYLDFFYNDNDISHKTILFDTMIFPDIGNILEQLKTRNLYIFCIKNKENVLGFYFFKNDKTYYEDLDCNTIRCISSIMNCKNTDVFFSGFLYSLRKILKREADYKILVFENICHNHIIHNIWQNKYCPIYTYKSAYYLYNYIYPGSPLNHTRCFVLM